MKIKLFKYGAAVVALCLLAAALKSLVPAASQPGFKIEDYPLAFWFLLGGIGTGVIAGILDVLDFDKDESRRNRQTTYDW